MLWIGWTSTSVGCARGDVTTTVVESMGGKTGARHGGIVCKVLFSDTL